MRMQCGMKWLNAFVGQLRRFWESLEGVEEGKVERGGGMRT